MMEVFENLLAVANRVGSTVAKVFKKPGETPTEPERVPQRRMQFELPDGGIYEVWLRPGDVVFPFHTGGKWTIFVKRA